MGLKKCPICELNYIQENEKYCDVCRRNIKGEYDEPDEAVTICVECGENPAVKGSELCAICLREARRQEKIMKGGDAGVGLDDVGLSDIEVPLVCDDMPEGELEEIDKELGDGMDDVDDEDEAEAENEDERREDGVEFVDGYFDEEDEDEDDAADEE